MRIASFFSLLVLAFLTGCSAPKERIVTKVEYVVINPERQYFKLTPVPSPTEPVVLSPGQVPDFESLYVNAAYDLIDAYSAIEMCNNDKRQALVDIQEKGKLYGR